MRRFMCFVFALSGSLWVVSPHVSGAEPSPRFRAELKRTLEMRKQRRQAPAASPQSIGAIVPYPMPPALIIRHTREVHDDIGAFLDALRR